MTVSHTHTHTYRIVRPYFDASSASKSASEFFVSLYFIIIFHILSNLYTTSSTVAPQNPSKRRRLLLVPTLRSRLERLLEGGHQVRLHVHVDLASHLCVYEKRLRMLDSNAYSTHSASTIHLPPRDAVAPVPPCAAPSAAAPHGPHCCSAHRPAIRCRPAAKRGCPPRCAPRSAYVCSLERMGG